MWEQKQMEAIKTGDSDAMNGIINKYARLLWPIVSAVLQNTGSEQDMEEVVADTFISLWEHPEKFDPQRGSLKTWLCLVARSRAIDRYRAITRHETFPLEDAVLAQCLGLQEALIRKEMKQELLAAIDALGEPGREILLRRYYRDQKPRQIALAMNMTVKQVDNILYRSKCSLRQILTQWEEVQYV